MKQILLSFMAALLLVGCAAPRYTTTQTNDEKDSVRVEYREKIVHVPDTVFMIIPAQTAERTTQDSTSHLENEYAESNARINDDGSLYHDLSTKPDTKPVPTQKQIEYRDSIVYRDRIKTETVLETEYIERNLSWWEKTQIYGFWLAVVVIMVMCRKPLLAIIKRLI